MTTTIRTATNNKMSVTLEQDKSGFYAVIVSEKYVTNIEYYKTVSRMVYGNEKAALRRFNAMKRKYITCNH